MAGNRSMIAINLSVFLLMIGVGLIVALLPQRIMRLSVSVSEVGMLASAYAIPNVLLQIPIGHLADRFGFKAFLVGGYVLCGLTGCLYFFADTPYLYFGGRFLQGIAEVPIWALAPASLSIQYAAEKGKFMGMYTASLHCGLTIGGLLSIFSFRIWQANEPFLLFAALSVVGGLISAWLVENPGHKTTTATAAVDTSGVRVLLTQRTNLLVFSGIALYGAGYGIFITLIPAFLISSKDASQTTICVFFALFYIILSLSQLLAGRWSDRRGRKPAMVAGLLLTSVGLALFPGCGQPAYMLFLALTALGLGVFCVSAMAFLNERVSLALKGTISGAFYFSWGAGYFLGPLVIGKAGAWLGFQSAFALFAGVIAAQLLAIVIVVQEEPGDLPPA